MNQKVLITLRNFIVSNNAFCDALRQEQIYIDNNILIELIIYYLTLNRNILYLLSFQERLIIKELITNQNFCIEDDFIILNNTTISISYFKQLVLKIENEVKPSIKAEIITIEPKEVPTLKLRQSNQKPKTKLRLIPFNNLNYYSYTEREVEYEQSTRLDSKTKPYIKESRDKYICLINDIVSKALTSNLENYSIKYLKLIASYLQLYPFTTYLRNKKEVPYEVLTIDHNRINLRKTIYEKTDINILKSQLISLVRYKQELEYEQERELQDEHISSHQITLTEQTIMNLDKEILKLSLEIYELENSPTIYNKNLIENIALSFENGTVSINKLFANPLLRIFLIDGDTSYFHCTLHLDTLFNLIDTNQLLSELEDNPILKLQY